MPVLSAGLPYPLGASYDGAGVNFALFSAHAEKVELCLFDDAGRSEVQRLTLPECTDQVWHGYLPGAQPGLLYGYRVRGAFDPSRGQRFAPQKLLLDPYAREWRGGFDWPHQDVNDNARAMPKCVVHHDEFDWGNDSPPAIPWTDTLLYEVHVKGFTMRHPGVAQSLRGTYAGLASAAAITYLKRLGITAVSLMPVHAFADERHLREKHLVNYWGYNSIGYFVPEARYSRGDALGEFKTMVKALHAAGIEVILDVVYNHTGEGDESGPTLSFRGIDNASYYRLRTDDRSCYENLSGCGNTLNLAHPRVLQMVMDSLRYWVRQMHVDGFRFDLAPALVRGKTQDFDPGSGFLDALAKDPELARVKLIAEPWDLGQDGYRLGCFPPRWTEWNDRYRDALRGFWLTRNTGAAELATRLAGSSDLFRGDGRRPQASINFITAHDGFTLSDLVSYNERHNAANREQNRDGHADNKSWNCGHEGASTDAEINNLRGRLKRALLATLLFSQGTPMLLAGDEIGRSQQGNNNAYCQDNPLTWLDWEAADHELLRFTCRLIELRKATAALRAARWLEGNPLNNGQCDIAWLTREGKEMAQADWEKNRCFGFELAPLHAGDIKLLVLLNSEPEEKVFTLPRGLWELKIDSAQADADQDRQILNVYQMQGASVAVLSQSLLLP
ncbi:MAG: glycogen debranching protein GlgX [Burkholderiales bacterium]